MPPSTAETGAVGLEEQTLKLFQVVDRADFARGAGEELLA
jgi:hypothetical protein